MTTLDDLNNTVGITIDDITPSKDAVAPVVSKASNLNLASYTAALSSDPSSVIDTYRNISAELDETGQSELSDELVRQAKQKTFKANQTQLVEVLASSDYTDEQKRQVAMAALDENNAQYSVRNMLSVEALAAPSKGESPRAEAQRVDMASIINNVNEVKYQEQQLLNAALVGENIPMIQTAAEVVDMLLPFSEAKMTGEVLAGMREGDAGAYATAMLTLGESKLDMREIIARTPMEDRVELTKRVIGLINDSSTIVMQDGNNFVQKIQLQQVLADGGYAEWERWVDNIVSVLDATIIGGPLAKAIKGSSAGKKATAIVDNARKRLVKTRVQPTTVAQNLKDTNPEKAKAAFRASVMDETGEAGEALYGASKNDIISNDMLPELKNSDGSVMSKVSEIEREIEWNPNIDLNVMRDASGDGAIYAFTEEKAQAMAAVVGKFKGITELTPRREMFQVEDLGDGVAIRAVFGPGEGGFSSAEDAINLAEWALRETGATADQIKLLARDGANYREVGESEFKALFQETKIVQTKSGRGGKRPTTLLVRKPRDFLVAVDHTYAFNPGDVVRWSEADVKYNIFDRIPLLSGKAQGSLQRHLMDAHSMLHPNITLGANVAVDKASAIEKDLLKLGEDFSKKFSKADPEIKLTMRKLIDEANHMGKEHSHAEMVAAGLRDNEIAAMKDWRKYWDNIHYLENRDLAKSLMHRGFMEYVDKLSDTKLFAKPIAAVTAKKVNKVYDPRTGEIHRLTEKQIDELYLQQGTLASLRDVMVVGDDVAEHILTYNKPGADYLRAINPNTKVLNYRKGYYSVHYKDPFFVVEKVKNSRGTVLFERAIATSGNKKDADTLAKLKASEGGKIFNDDFYVRGDLKKMDITGDDYWSLAQVQGRSAQKARGKRLEMADTNVMDPSMTNILDPVDSMVLSARSISHRTAMRDLIETTKTRFNSQYADFLPVDNFGKKVFPANIDEIMYRGGKGENAKQLADARTTYEYVKFLEDGYINAIDNTYKSVLKVISDVLGNAGFNKLASGARWMSETRGPSAMLKNQAFTLYLALNPLRQLVVQGHQAMQLMAFNPGWVASKRFTPQVSIMVMKQNGMTKIPDAFLRESGWTAKQADAVFEAFRKSGHVASIDKQNLVRGALLNLGDQMSLGKSFAGRTWKVVTAPITISRKVGFDAGEYFNMMTAYLAHYDDALRKGKYLTRSDNLAEVAGRARNFTYNMNAAGDMPYNQNFLAAVFQFMQVPHKAVLGMLTNRALSPAQKARLIGFNSIMYTLPPAAMYSWFGEDGLDILPDDPEYRDLVVQGMEGAILNKLLSLASGEDTRIDWSGLAAMDVHGSLDFVHSMLTTDLGTMLAESPSGQLYFGNNPRITNFAKTTARYFNVIEDYESPTEFGQVAMEFARMASGFSNAFKAAYALEYDKKYGMMNLPQDNDIPTPEAIALTFGFQGMEDAQARYVNNTLYERSEAFRNDVNKGYQETKRHILSQDPSTSQNQFVGKMTSEMWRVFGNTNAEAKALVSQNLLRDLADKDARMYEKALKSGGIMSHEEREGIFRSMPFRDEEQRAKALEANNYINSYKEE